ncbi:MAG: APC family permease [Actinomycetes bacterium]
MTVRVVGLPGATAIGAGAMLGAGVFAVWGPAAAQAGSLLVVAVVLAGVAAMLNAGSTAQLAAVYPVAGGAYAYGRAELGAWPGFVAGIGFVVGKTASIAAIGLAMGHYVWPERPAVVATLAILASWALNSRGITRTSAAAVVLASLTIGVLVLAVIASGGAAAPAAPLAAPDGALTGVLGAAALVFFAFAGYARIATLGEEVVRPAVTIPRAIATALGTVLGMYLALALALPAALGERLATSGAPVADAVAGSWLPAPLVTAAAVAAAFGSLLALTAGLGRTAMAMAREGDLPGVLSRTSGGVPVLAEGLACVAAVGLAWRGDLTLAIAMSSFAVLLYYAVAGTAAFRAAGAGRVAGWRMPRPLSAVGVAVCVALMASLPGVAVASAAALLVVAAAVRAIAARRARE